MTTETEFLNGALGLIGATRITAIDDNSVNANYCKTFYPMLRQALLRLDHWNFATGRASLAADLTPPPFEFAFSYELPADWLKMREFNGGQTNTEDLIFNGTVWVHRYVIEGSKLLTNEDAALIVYTRDEPNPTKWDSLFGQTLMHWLASYLANAIPKDQKKAAGLLNVATSLFLPLATGVNGQERTIHPYVVDDLTRGR